MDGEVIDVFFKSENITIITNVTDPLNATAEPIETTTYELQWDKDSCMEPWKHTLQELGLYRPSKLYQVEYLPNFK